jgi:predicted permease
MEQVLTKALAFVAVIALGYFLKKRGFFKPHDYELIAKIVLNITLPCAVITSFAAFKMDSFTCGSRPSPKQLFGIPIFRSETSSFKALMKS